MHRSLSYFLSAPNFHAPVPRYKFYIIALGFFNAEVTHRLCRGPGFPSNVVVYALKRCFFAFTHPKFFCTGATRYYHTGTCFDAEVRHRLCKAAYAIKRSSFLIYSPNFFMHRCRAILPHCAEVQFFLQMWPLVRYNAVPFLFTVAQNVYAQVPRYIITLEFVLRRAFLMHAHTRSRTHTRTHRCTYLFGFVLGFEIHAVNSRD